MSSASFNARILPLPQVDPSPFTPDASPGARSVGLCFSGGGSRALTCAMGQLRGLRLLGLLDDVFAISSVSGGTWANALYTYLPESISDDNFLGQPVLDPSVLTLFEGPYALDKLPPGNLGWVPTGLDLFDDLDEILKLKLEYGYPNADLWQGLIGDRILARYGLFEPDAQGFDNHYVSWTDAYLHLPNGTLARNPSLKASQFRTVQRQRPFPIFNTAVFTNDGLDAELAPFEANFMLGVRNALPAGHGAMGAIGGGLVDSFAMTSQYQGEGPPGTGTVSTSVPARPFALNDIVGCSSAAFAQMLEEKYTELEGMVPRYAYWPVQARASQQALRYRFADGGSLENMGLNALLARGVPRIMAFVNTDEPIYRDDSSGDIVISSDIPPLFGFQPWVAGQGYVPYSQNPGSGATRLYRHNQVFPISQFQPLLNALYAARQAGGSMLVTQQLQVLANSWFNVPAQASVTVLWVYNDFVQSWWNQLHWTVRDAIDAESLGQFPRYNTFTQLWLPATLVNALAHLSCWNVASPSTLGNPGGQTNAQVVQALFG